MPKKSSDKPLTATVASSIITWIGLFRALGGFGIVLSRLSSLLGLERGKKIGTNVAVQMLGEKNRKGGLKENSLDLTGIHHKSSHESLRVEIHTARITMDQ